MQTAPFRIDTPYIHEMQAPQDRCLRFLLYCHDTYGLGHLRRTLALAEYFTRTLSYAEVLIVTGAPLAHAFTLPPRVDYVKLPAVTKSSRGEYEARSLTMDFVAVRDLRASLLRETVLAYKPDVFLVDHAPHGMKGEVLPTLNALRVVMPNCLRVLGLRDIVDAGAIVQQTWTQENIYYTLDHSYDLILIYGSQQFYDIGQEYRLPPTVLPRIRYCGYLDRVTDETMIQPQASVSSSSLASTQPLVVVTAGGGGDGFPLLSTYLHSLQQMKMLPYKSLLITGPLMNEEEQCTLRHLAASLPTEAVQIEAFIPDSVSLFRSADLVVSMAGYNTIVELLALQKRMLLIPRTVPRLEQYERAIRLAQHNLAGVLLPDDLTPSAIMHAVQHALTLPHPQTTQIEAAGITFCGQSIALQSILSAPNRPYVRQQQRRKKFSPALIMPAS